MSIAKIRAALESRLNGIASPLPTAWENVTYTPTVGTAWQKVNLLVNTPVDYAISNDVVEQRGFLQITVYYPIGVGSATAIAKAEAIAARFAPVQTLTSSTTTVEILKTAHVGSAVTTDEWYIIPISVEWRSFS